MVKEERQKKIDTSWEELHSKVEARYLKNLAKKIDKEWLTKQCKLLADMALHLSQTTINQDEMNQKD